MGSIWDTLKERAKERASEQNFNGPLFYEQSTAQRVGADGYITTEHTMKTVRYNPSGLRRVLDEETFP